MFDNLSGLAIGLIVFTIIVVVGQLVITNVANSQATCNATYTVFNVSDRTCWNATASGYTPVNSAFTQGNTLMGYLGTTGGGLASWTLAIIALAVGMLFIGALMNKRKY